MKDKKRLIKILSCALTLAVACSCRAATEKQTEAPALPKTESFPPYSETIETTSSSETTETTAPETSAENLELSEEPAFEFSEAQKMIEDFFLGVWESESNERFMIGIAEESDCGDFFNKYGLLWDAHLTDTSAVIVSRNFISDRFRIVIDFCDPDVLLFYDNDEEKADGDCQKYTRVGDASMYPDTGIMNSYFMSMLYHCYGYIELHTEIESLSTASVYFNGKNAGKELTVLISHDDQQIVFASSFMPLVNQNGEDGITYIRYTKIKNEGEWLLGDWSYVDYETIEEMTQETEPEDDFSDIVELTREQRMEKFDQIAERAFHTEIKNEMEMEEIISCLMDRYIICTYTYVLSSLFDLATDENGSWITITDQDQNEYHKIQFRYFNTLAEMEDFTKNTCTQSRAELYVSSSSSMDVYIPKFIENEDGIYYCMPSYFISPSPAFYDDYVVEIKEQSETECVFSYNANVDPKRYNQMLEANGEMVWAESDFYHEGRIVFENGKWKVDYVSPAAF